MSDFIEYEPPASGTLAAISLEHAVAKLRWLVDDPYGTPSDQALVLADIARTLESVTHYVDHRLSVVHARLEDAQTVLPVGADDLFGGES